MKQYRDACAWAFIAAKPLGWKVGPVAVDVEFRSHRATGRYHPRDIDNAISSTKQIWDGAKDAGVLLSDAKRNFEIADFKLYTTEREVTKAGGPGVFVTVRRI